MSSQVGRVFGSGGPAGPEPQRFLAWGRERGSLMRLEGVLQTFVKDLLLWSRPWARC